MKRSYSLKGRKLFKEVYKKGKKIQGKGARIFVLKIDNFNKIFSDKIWPLNRKKIEIGIAIQKRYGNAVFRNKAKRKIRSICREFLDIMNDGYIFIINPGDEFRNLSYEESKSDIKSLLQKSGIINKR